MDRQLTKTDHLHEVNSFTEKPEAPAHCFDLLYKKLLIYTTHAYSNYESDSIFEGNQNILKALETISLLQGLAGDIQETHFSQHMKPFYEIWKDQLTTACQNHDQALLILVLNTMRDMQKAWGYLISNQKNHYYQIKLMHA